MTPGTPLVRRCPQGCLNRAHLGKRILRAGTRCVAVVSPDAVFGLSFVRRTLLGSWAVSTELANRAVSSMCLAGLCDSSLTLGASGFLSSCSIICSSEAFGCNSDRDNRLRLAASPLLVRMHPQGADRRRSCDLQHPMLGQVRSTEGRRPAGHSASRPTLVDDRPPPRLRGMRHRSFCEHRAKLA
jgi:hypothetical protein